LSLSRSEKKRRKDGVKCGKVSHWMRRSGMTDQQGIRIVDNLASKENPSLDALEHCAMKNERQVGEA